MEKSNFIHGITKFWWLPLISGLIVIGFGIWCLCDPRSSLEVFAYIFTGCLAAVGLFNLIYALCNTRSSHGWGWPLACGIIEIFCAVWLFCQPANVLTWVFIWAIALYVIFEAINAIAESFMISTYANFWLGWLLILLLVALVFAFFFIGGPIAGGIFVWWYIGVSLICYGVYRIIFAAKIYKINQNFK